MSALRVRALEPAQHAVPIRQRVAMEIFGGRTWREDPTLLRPMMDAFYAVRDAHEVLVLARAAKRLVAAALAAPGEET